MRRRYPAALKAKVALEAVKGDRTLAELTSCHEVRADLIRQWNPA